MNDTDLIDYMVTLLTSFDSFLQLSLNRSGELSAEDKGIFLQLSESIVEAEKLFTIYRLSLSSDTFSSVAQAHRH
jgi:hypothetical protein